ncbi:glycosyltransferase family 4 protein (plasmid) [Sulfitobacter pontiacus]|uniref:glycosyltransferase family 4 protein n=1 Tax=Sulfitobacter pontiacus TaxID=60137 RepID=UPI002AC9659A|nr:glycosyltransferase family 4 protein [Sulfitobacter pontiacus]WPZ27567.1 glycosyltransferase family 4 protein [Sulfitobacter pontiacus]
MRILIPILGFAPQGGYRVLSELANAWIRLGHECAFLVPATSAEPYFPTTAKIIRSDRKGLLRDRQSKRKSTGLNNIVCLYAGLRRIGKDYDIILANHSLTAWPVRFARTGNARKFYYIQAYEPQYYPVQKYPIKHVLAKLSYFFDLTQISNSKIYKGAGLQPKAVIPPGIDLSVFVAKERPGTFEKENQIVLGTIGRTEPYKGTSVALAAYRLLRLEDNRLQMNIGFGNVTPAEDLKITAINGDSELAAYYRSVDILIVSCIGQQGAPHYPLIEAMASGTPVVHTGYFPGTPENTWVASDTSSESVAAAIRQVINASLKARSAKAIAAREVVASSLEWSVVANGFLDRFVE